MSHLPSQKKINTRKKIFLVLGAVLAVASTGLAVQQTAAASEEGGWICFGDVCSSLSRR
jgi:hypothetical protein